MIVARRSVGFTDKAMTTLTWPKEKSLVCTRVLIADDQPRARRSLTALLTAMRWSTPNYTEHLHDSANRVLFPLRSLARRRTVNRR